MRQAGILAAAGIYALEHHVKRLEEDHANAARLANGLREFSGVVLEREPETKMVLFRVADVPGFLAKARDRGVLMGSVSPEQIRAVTHLDVDEHAIDAAVARLEDVLA